MTHRRHKSHGSGTYGSINCAWSTLIVEDAADPYSQEDALRELPHDEKPGKQVDDMIEPDLTLRVFMCIVVLREQDSAAAEGLSGAATIVGSLPRLLQYAYDGMLMVSARYRLSWSLLRRVDIK